MNHNIDEKGDTLPRQSFITIHTDQISPKNINHPLFLLKPTREINNTIEF